MTFALYVADLVACNVLIDGGAWPGGAQLYREARSRLLPDLRAATALGHFRASPEDRLMALSGSRVTVTGLSRLGATLWTLLTAAGVGRVDADDEQPISAEDVSIGGFNPSDVGRRRSELPELRSEWVTQPRPRHLTKHLHVLTDVADFEERSRKPPAQRAAPLVAVGQRHVRPRWPLRRPRADALSYLLHARAPRRRPRLARCLATARDRPIASG